MAHLVSEGNFVRGSVHNNKAGVAELTMGPKKEFFCLCTKPFADQDQDQAGWGGVED